MRIKAANDTGVHQGSAAKRCSLKVLLLGLALLSACSGGGGGGSATPATSTEIIMSQNDVMKKLFYALLLCIGWLTILPSHATELSGISKIAAGSDHTCALTTEGSVKCWGRNSEGQLGDNSKTQRLTPVNVVGLSNGVVAVAAGDYHTCALTTAGAVKCWGYNLEGELGDNSTTYHSAPVDVIGLTSGVVAIAAGNYHTCALTVAGGVKCWGANELGQIGDNSQGNKRLIPVDVTGLANGVTSISAGRTHTCALTVTGGVKCWGYNSVGQLGDGTQIQRLVPVDVMGLASGVLAIAAGYSNACAITIAGGVKCWGAQIIDGSGSTRSQLSPEDVPGLTSGMTAVTAGTDYTCVLNSGGGVKCWGANFIGQLGDNSTSARLTPVDVTGLASGVAVIAAGYSHSCALAATGTVKCWGNNFYGQLGNNAAAARFRPTDVTGLASGVAAITAGYEHNCALTAAAGVKCWGRNDRGQLGNNSTARQLTPVDVMGLSGGVAAIAAGGGFYSANDLDAGSHTCALTAAGAMKCWGDNSSGQLGDNSTTQRLMPVDVTGLSGDVAAIAVGGGFYRTSAINSGSHTCALTAAGAMKCWGDNSSGQLGDNSATQRLTPVDVTGLSSGVTAIAAGVFHTCALTTEGGVKCWGRNSEGQLGVDSTITQRLTPDDVAGLTSGVKGIASGSFHTCALTTAGGVRCWGYNRDGQLGASSSGGLVADVTNLTSGVVAIAAGEVHTCALTATGGVKCWGANYYGQLGDDRLQPHGFTPVDVTGLTSGVMAIAAGTMHTCALTTAGAVKCWGATRYGQIGDGNDGTQPVPVSVVILDSPLVVEFYNTILDNYFITADFGEAAAIDSGSAGPGWTRTGNSFKSGGDTAVCRFYGSQSPGPNSHFYTLDVGECDGLKQLQASTPDTQKRWNFEVLDFVSTSPANGTCPTGTTPVYRAYNNGYARGIDSNHRISSSTAAIQEVVNRGWSNEGVVMCAPN